MLPVSNEQLHEALFGGITARTRKRYERLHGFLAESIGVDTPEEALGALCASDRQRITHVLIDYRERLVLEKDAATARHSMSAIRNALRYAHGREWTDFDPDSDWPFAINRKKRAEPVPDGYACLSTEHLNKTSARKSLQHINYFSSLMDYASGDDALQSLCGMRRPQAHLLIDRYRRKMEREGKASGTIASRLSVLKVCVDRLRVKGLTELTLDIKLPSQNMPKGERAPNESLWRRLMDAPETQAEAENSTAKNLAIYRLLRYVVHDDRSPLRVVEALDLADVDVKAGTIRIGGTRRTLDSLSLESLIEWRKERGTRKGPLFTCGKNGARGWSRLTSAGLWSLIRRLGRNVLPIPIVRNAKRP